MFQRTSGTTFEKYSAAARPQEETPVTDRHGGVRGMDESRCLRGSLVTGLARPQVWVVGGRALFCAERVILLIVGPTRSGAAVKDVRFMRPCQRS
jgi:hypothetical protein